MTMDKNKYEELLNKLYKVKKIQIPQDWHFDGSDIYGKYAMLNGVDSKILGMYSQALGIKGYNNLYNQLRNLGTVYNAYADKEINFKEIADQMNYGAERLRTKPMYAYVDENEGGVMYGAVGQHTRIHDLEVHNLCKNFFESIGENYEAEYDHNVQWMRERYTFPELSIDIGNNDYIGYSVIASNSFCGFGALRCDTGFLRFICSNGVVVYATKENRLTSWQTHSKNSKEDLLNTFAEQLKTSFKYFDKLASRIKQACEITDAYIDEKTSMVKWLPSNFNILVSEAQEIFRVYRQSDVYKNTAFWVGQAIAEYAKDRPLDAKIRLEKIAGQVMFAQVKI